MHEKVEHQFPRPQLLVPTQQPLLQPENWADLPRLPLLPVQRPPMKRPLLADVRLVLPPPLVLAQLRLEAVPRHPWERFVELRLPPPPALVPRSEPRVPRRPLSPLVHDRLHVQLESVV